MTHLDHINRDFQIIAELQRNRLTYDQMCRKFKVVNSRISQIKRLAEENGIILPKRTEMIGQVKRKR